MQSIVRSHKSPYRTLAEFNNSLRLMDAATQHAIRSLWRQGRLAEAIRALEDAEHARSTRESRLTDKA